MACLSEFQGLEKGPTNKDDQSGSRLDIEVPEALCMTALAYMPLKSPPFYGLVYV